MAIMSLVKLFITLVGIALTFWFLMHGLIKKNRKQVWKGIKVLVSVACLLLLLTIGEFVYAYSI
ncbi:hypothetical protein B0E43_22215 [Algoriphagus sp. A40]|nr:hypothetical protein B0E43_22215 [Algoriphagus sp. A40]